MRDSYSYTSFLSAFLLHLLLFLASYQLIRSSPTFINLAPEHGTHTQKASSVETSIVFWDNINPSKPSKALASLKTPPARLHQTTITTPKEKQAQSSSSNLPNPSHLASHQTEKHKTPLVLTKTNQKSTVTVHHSQKTTLPSPQFHPNTTQKAKVLSAKKQHANPPTQMLHTQRKKALENPSTKITVQRKRQDTKAGAKLVSTLENDLQQELQQEQTRLKDQDKKTKAIIQYKQRLLTHISEYWRIPPDVDPQKICELNLYMSENGEVSSVTILRKSGDPRLDESARLAVLQASPLPVPNDQVISHSFRHIHLSVQAKQINQAGSS